MWWAQGRKWLPKTGWASSNAAPSILPKTPASYAPGYDWVCYDYKFESTEDLKTNGL